MVVDIANCKIPTGFNSKGEATGYKILSKDTINTAKTNMEELIGSIISITNTMTGDLSANFDENSIKKLNLFNSAFEAIGHTLSLQVDNSKPLNKNTHALKTYIKAINTVDTSKLKPLTTLVVELNKLANKLGSLDKVADTLSNELAVVLKNLVDSLTEAKDTIDSAHQLQSDRHKKIEEAINTVRGLMDSTLKINVSTESSSTTGPNSTVTPENNKQNSSSGPIILSGGSGGSNGGSNRNNSNTPPTRKNN
jgi:methyl-accepting chemotaxis protein